MTPSKRTRSLLRIWVPRGFETVSSRIGRAQPFPGTERYPLGISQCSGEAEAAEGARRRRNSHARQAPGLPPLPAGRPGVRSARRAGLLGLGLLVVLGAASACTERHGLRPGVGSFAVQFSPLACTTDAACGAAGRCSAGVCSCAAGAVCPAGTACDPADQCRPSFDIATPAPYVSGMSCTTDGICDGTDSCRRFCSEGGHPCMRDTDCGIGETCLGVCTARLEIDVRAVPRDCEPGPDGAFFTCPVYPFDGIVHLQAAPGFVPPGDAYLTMTGGELQRASAYVARASGRTHLWVEVDGYVRRAAMYGQCNDSLDNDRNGLIDLADPGCVDGNDDCEGCEADATGVSESPFGATGLSPDIWYEPPSIRNLQYDPDSVIFSPLEGDNLIVDQGDMVVTSVTSTGMYVTDVRFHEPVLTGVHPTGNFPLVDFERYVDQAGYYDSLFLFTFSSPAGVIQGDILCWFAGGVVEYQGNTQIKFPTYEIYRPYAPECDGLRERLGMPRDAGRLDILRRLGLVDEEVDPETELTEYKLAVDRLTVDITDLLEPEMTLDEETGLLGPVDDFKDVVSANATVLEPLESTIVEVRDVQVATRFIECDANGSGDIDAGTDEDTCRDDCQEDPLCTDLRSYERYNQWAGFFANAKKMYVDQQLLKERIPLRLQAVGLPDTDNRCTMRRVWIGDTRFYEYRCPETRYSSVRGTLRQIYLCPRKVGNESCSLQLVSLTPTSDDDVVPFTEER